MNRRCRKLSLAILALVVLCVLPVVAQADTSSASQPRRTTDNTNQQPSAPPVPPTPHGRWSWDDDIIRNSSFEWSFAHGQWCVEAGHLKTESRDDKESWFAFGDPGWRDYEFTIQASTGRGTGQLLFGIRGGPGSSYRLVLGADDNSAHKLLRVVHNPKTHRQDMAVLESAKGFVDYGRSHRLRVRCQGSCLRVWLDDRSLFDFTDDNGPQAGWLSVGARNVEAQFRNFKVATLDGKMLFEGLPTRARGWFAIGRGTVELDYKQPLDRICSLKVVSQVGQTGIEQRHLALAKGAWRCRMWVRGEAPDGLVVSLRDADKTIAEKTLSVPGCDWCGLPFDLTVDGAVADATLRILTSGQAAVWIDQVELMPTPSAASRWLAHIRR